MGRDVLGVPVRSSGLRRGGYEMSRPADDLLEGLVRAALQWAADRSGEVGHESVCGAICWVRVCDAVGLDAWAGADVDAVLSQGPCFEYRRSVLERWWLGFLVVSVP